MAKPVHIPKPLASRILELVQSLLVLRDSIEKVRSGNLHQFIPIYGQLRALLFEKAKGNKSLLIDLANILKQPLELWCMKPAEAEHFPALVLSMSGFPVSIHQQFPEQEKVTIEKFLKHKFLYYKKQHYSVSEVITYFANYAGGAHFATKVKSDFAEVLAINIGNFNAQSGLFNFLLQIAEVIYELSIRLIKRLNDIEIHLTAFIPSQDITSLKYIFDTRYPDTPMRASVIVNQERRIIFRVVGINGMGAQVVSDRLIDFTKAHYFIFSYQIDKKLTMNMQISIDGEIFGEMNFQFPVFFVNDLVAHETFYNRAVDDEKTGLKYAFAFLGLVDPESSFIEKYRVIVNFYEELKKDDLMLVVYTENDYAYSKPGTTNLTLPSGVYKSSLKKLQDGDWSKPPPKEEAEMPEAHK